MNFSLEHNQCALWMDMGLGKTVVTLSAILDRMDRGEVFRALVIAPLRVCQLVWRQEAAKWSHLQDLTFSLIHGTPMQRHRAFRSPALVHLTNYENVVWLVDQLAHHYLSKGQYPPYNMVVYDEVTKFKESQTKRHKALRKLLPFLPYRMGLTGTPGGSGYMGLFGQYLAIDSGLRLGTRKGEFQQTYFFNAGWGQYANWKLKDGAKEVLQAKVRDITLQISAADHLDLPEVVVNDIEVELPPKLRQDYDQLEREMFLELDSGNEMEVFNAAALSTKTRQFANGAVYLRPGGPWEEVHRLKLDALEELLEEAAGSPVLLAFQFKHDAERIKERFTFAEHMHSGLGDRKIEDLRLRWNRGEIPLLIGHPLSMGHGLNLQDGGNTLAWFGLNWSSELYNQFNGRLLGGLRGVGKRIMVHRILTRLTTDYLVKHAVEDRLETEDELKQAFNEYRKSRGF